MKIRFKPDDFIRDMEAYAEHMTRQIEKGLDEGAQIVERSARKKCPKGTDALRQSITHKVDMRGARGTAVVGSELEYAPYVHEGTGIHVPMGRQDVPWSYQDEKGDWHTTDGMEPNPFLENARKECADRVHQVLLYALKG